MEATGDEFIIGELRKSGAEWLMDPSDEHQQAEAIRRLVAATAAAERERCAKLVDGEPFKNGGNDARRGPLSVGTWHENSPMGYAMRELARAIRMA